MLRLGFECRIERTPETISLTKTHQIKTNVNKSLSEILTFRMSDQVFYGRQMTIQISNNGQISSSEKLRLDLRKMACSQS
jgi:hypothetical protein